MLGFTLVATNPARGQTGFFLLLITITSKQDGPQLHLHSPPEADETSAPLLPTGASAQVQSALQLEPSKGKAFHIALKGTESLSFRSRPQELHSLMSKSGISPLIKTLCGHQS